MIVDLKEPVEMSFCLTDIMLKKSRGNKFLWKKSRGFFFPFYQHGIMFPRDFFSTGKIKSYDKVLILFLMIDDIAHCR